MQEFFEKVFEKLTFVKVYQKVMELYKRHLIPASHYSQASHAVYQVCVQDLITRYIYYRILIIESSLGFYYRKQMRLPIIESGAKNAPFIRSVRIASDKVIL